MVLTVATIEVAVMGIASFVVNESPGVQARENEKLEASEKFSVIFCPSKEGLGGGGFITMNASGKVNARGILRRRLAFNIVNRISPVFRKATHSKIGGFFQRTPPLNQKTIVVAAREGKRSRKFAFLLAAGFNFDDVMRGALSESSRRDAGVSGVGAKFREA